MKKTITSIVLGLILAIVPISIFANCAQYITSGGQTCKLKASTCDSSGCVCVYTCGPNLN
jgi:hypothetical protein